MESAVKASLQIHGEGPQTGQPPGMDWTPPQPLTVSGRVVWIPGLWTGGSQAEEEGVYLLYTYVCVCS